MNRRSALFTLTSAAAATAIAGRSLGAPAGMMTGPADIEHAKKTAAIGAVSLQAALVALQKARTAKVAEFAKFEHDEQKTVAQILKAMDPKLTPVPDPTMLAGVQKLKAMPAGPAFEKAFVTAQIEGHQALLEIQATALKGGLSPAAAYVTMLVSGMVNEHLTLLSNLRRMMG